MYLQDCVITEKKIAGLIEMNLAKMEAALNQIKTQAEASANEEENFAAGKKYRLKEILENLDFLKGQKEDSDSIEEWAFAKVSKET